MVNKSGKSCQMVFLLLALILGQVIVGCKVETNNPSPNGTPCPTVQFGTPIPKLTRPLLIIGLIKQTPGYLQYSGESLNILQDILPQVIEPGDRVVLMSMEQSDINRAVFFDATVKPVPYPSIPPTPFKALTPTKLPTVQSTSESTLIQKIENDKLTQQAAVIEMTSTQGSFDYECAKESYNKSFKKEFDNWERDRDKAIKTFSKFFNEQAEDVESDDFVSKNQVFEAFQIASLFINNECNKYNSCVLLIFSDLEDFRGFRPPEINVDFTGVDVVALLQHCEFTYQQSCKKRIEFWQDNLTAYNAKTSNFLAQKEIAAFLLDFLRR